MRDTGYGFGRSEDHNLIVVDGKSQGRICGRLLRFESGPEADQAAVEAEVDPGAVHRRAIYYRRGNFFILYDRILSDEIHDYSWRLHFDGTAACKNGRVTFRAPGGAGLLVVPFGPAPVRLEEAETVVFSDEKGLSSRPVSRAVMDVRAKEAAFATLLLPFKGEAPRVEARTVPTLNGMTMQLRVNHICHAIRLEEDVWTAV